MSALRSKIFNEKPGLHYEEHILKINTSYWNLIPFPAEKSFLKLPALRDLIHVTSCCKDKRVPAPVCSRRGPTQQTVWSSDIRAQSSVAGTHLGAARRGDACQEVWERAQTDPRAVGDTDRERSWHASGRLLCKALSTEVPLHGSEWLRLRPAVEPRLEPPNADSLQQHGIIHHCVLAPFVLFRQGRQFLPLILSDADSCLVEPTFCLWRHRWGRWRRWWRRQFLRLVTAAILTVSLQHIILLFVYLQHTKSVHTALLMACYTVEFQVTVTHKTARDSQTILRGWYGHRRGGAGWRLCPAVPTAIQDLQRTLRHLADTSADGMRPTPLAAKSTRRVSIATLLH
jgi:hypothetical protein